MRAVTPRTTRPASASAFRCPQSSDTAATCAFGAGRFAFHILDDPVLYRSSIERLASRIDRRVNPANSPVIVRALTTFSLHSSQQHACRQDEERPGDRPEGFARHERPPDQPDALADPHNAYHQQDNGDDDCHSHALSSLACCVHRPSCATNDLRSCYRGSARKCPRGCSCRGTWET